MIHPSEEHALTLSSAHRHVHDAHGAVVGAVPRILPGSLEEREVLMALDARRWDEEREKLSELATRMTPSSWNENALSRDLLIWAVRQDAKLA